jgi:large repetitive protein
LAYTESDLTIEIPSLGIVQEIVGVPQTSNGWDVSWLGNEIGYLQGTAFPTWAGNSVLTGHVTGADGLPGVFADLGTLKWGDQIIIHAFGQKYVYEVRTVDLSAGPDTSKITSKHEELPWLTLITCRGYDEKTHTYRLRTVVRAVQVSVTEE